MKNKILLILGLIILIAISANFVISLKRSNEKPEISGPYALINDKIINLEIAQTEAQRNKGLGDRDSLAENSGMLFIFGQKDKYSFWMKGMRFSLDIIWIADDKIVDISKNVPFASSPNNLPLYQPVEKINYVLEVNAGFSEINNIKIGDTVDFKL